MQWCSNDDVINNILTLMPMPMVSHHPKSHIAPHFNHPELRNVMVPFMMPLTACYANAMVTVVTWYWWQCQWQDMMPMLTPMVPYDTNIIFHLILIIITKGLQWYNWWCHWHCITQMLEPVVSHEQTSCCTSFQLSWTNECNGVIDHTVSLCETKTYAIAWQIPTLMPMPIPVVSFDHKTPVAPHFSWVGLRNVMVPVMMVSVPHDTGGSANGLIWQKSHVAPYFGCLHLIIAVVEFFMLLVSCNNDTSDNGITCQNVMLHLILVFLT